MNYINVIGEPQPFEWQPYPKAQADALSRIHHLLSAQDFEGAQRLLLPLLEKENAEAQFLAAGFSWGEESAETFEKRHFELLEKAAQQDYPPALYALGVYYDVGDGVAEDKAKAAQLFQRAAMRKHPHSQWLHGLNLLYGTHGIELDPQRGIEQITAAADAKFQGALETMASFYERGEFSFPQDGEKARMFKALARRDDAIGY